MCVLCEDVGISTVWRGLGQFSSVLRWNCKVLAGFWVIFGGFWWVFEWFFRWRKGWNLGVLPKFGIEMGIGGEIGW
jgi:hypothetical protein